MITLMICSDQSNMIGDDTIGMMPSNPYHIIRIIG